MHESFLPKAKLILRSAEHLPEMRWTPSVLGHIALSEKAAILTIRRNDGTMSYDAFVGEDASFLKWAGDLFTHEWQKAGPWHP